MNSDASGRIWIDGKLVDVLDVLQNEGMPPPPVSPLSSARIYFDTSQEKLLLSENGGAYGPFGTGGSSSWSSLTGTPTALLLDQTPSIPNGTPQTIVNGVPTFGQGFRADSFTNALGYAPSSFAWDGLMGGWTINKMLFNSISTPKIVNLLTNGFVKTSGSDGTLGVDTNTYLTDAPSDGTTYGRKNGAWAAASGGSMVYPGAGIALSTGSAWDTSITNNSANWNTAYGWGNHASAGYLTDAPGGGAIYGRGSGAWQSLSSYYIPYSGSTADADLNQRDLANVDMVSCNRFTMLDYPYNSYESRFHGGNAQTGHIDYYLPVALPGSSKFLQCTTGGVLSWETPGGGGMTNPMTALGDIIYEDATPVPARLAGNTTTTKKFLRQTGTGSVSAVPAWDTLATTDIPDISATYAPVAQTMYIGTTGVAINRGSAGLTLAGITLTTPNIGVATTTDNIKGEPKHLRCTLIDPPTAYGKTAVFPLWVSTDAAIHVIDIKVSCDIDPTTELDVDLMYANAIIGLASPTSIAVMDTTAGVYASGAISVAVAASKCVYISFAASPDAALKFISFDVTYTYD